MDRTSTSKAFSVYKQSAQYQRPMHTASTTLNSTLTSMHSSSTSMLTVSTASFQSINNQFALYQQPMCSASTANAHSTRLPYARFLQHEDFHSVQYSSHPVILRWSQRRSRRIHPSRKYALPGVGMTVLKVPSPSTREVILTSKSPLLTGEGDRLRWVRVMIASN